MLLNPDDSLPSERSSPLSALRLLLAAPLDAQRVRDIVADQPVELTLAPDIAGARRILQNSAVDLLLADVVQTDGDGLELLMLAQSIEPNVLVAIIHEPEAQDSARHAERLGAIRTLSRPLSSDMLAALIRSALEQRGLLRTNADLRRQVEGPLHFDRLIGRHPDMQRAFARIQASAGYKAPVWLHAEPGTGKSLVARVLHEHSPRRQGPFCEVDCDALPEIFLGSELFGHTKGAFTGALSNKDGRLTLCAGGTIFLDNVDQLAHPLQERLLRVLTEKKFEPMGSSRTLYADIRLITASSIDLMKLVETGGFREDLAEKLQTVRVELPPLRERIADLPALAEHFLRKCARSLSRRVVGFTPEALDGLLHHDWPRNVAELEAVVESAAVLARAERITPDELPDELQPPTADQTVHAPSGPIQTLREALLGPEKQAILNALEAHDWNRQRAAAALNINRTTLYKKMRQYNLQDPHGRNREEGE